jgi:hypothetical protein
MTNCKLCGIPTRFHFKNERGYILVYAPLEHPNLGLDGKIFEHILVAEKKIGRYLTENESVHHINHVRHDNRPQNLAVMLNDDDHAYIHKHDKKGRIK